MAVFAIAVEGTFEVLARWMDPVRTAHRRVGDRGGETRATVAGAATP